MDLEECGIGLLVHLYEIHVWDGFLLKRQKGLCISTTAFVLTKAGVVEKCCGRGAYSGVRILANKMVVVMST